MSLSPEAEAEDRRELALSFRQAPSTRLQLPKPAQPLCRDNNKYEVVHSWWLNSSHH
jgi:hypothetical protein